jgi:acetoin utilization protein AcuC
VSPGEPVRAVFMNSRRLGEFSFSPEHPFKPERIRNTRAMCEEKGLFSDPAVRIVDIEKAEEGVLERFHTEEYIRVLKRAGKGNEIDLDMLHYGVGSAENPVFKGLYEFVTLTATTSLQAARLVMNGGAESAFNPCGGFHHAHADRASGFCYVNDVVIAIDELKSGGKRVAYVDIDAHHGDAVQEKFYHDPGVLTISIHESGKTLFPWGGFERELGEGAGRGFNINIPLEPGTDDDVFLELFRSIIMEALVIFEPEIIVGQFGTDMLATDPLTHLHLTNNGYIEAIKMLHAKFPRIVALGGGGYNMNDVVRGWTLLWLELAGLKLDEGYGGALGGVFLGDSSIQGSDLRDMRLYTTGPVKDRLIERAAEVVSFFYEEIKPLLRGR